MGEREAESERGRENKRATEKEDQERERGCRTSDRETERDTGMVMFVKERASVTRQRQRVAADTHMEWKHTPLCVQILCSAAVFAACSPDTEVHKYSISHVHSHLQGDPVLRSEVLGGALLPILSLE